MSYDWEPIFGPSISVSTVICLLFFDLVLDMFLAGCATAHQCTLDTGRIYLKIKLHFNCGAFINESDNK